VIRLLSIVAVILLGAATRGEAAETARFQAIDIFVDSKARLAAYQIEFFATAGEVMIVGIEGGEHAAFKSPPHYDPRAIQRERVIIAAFNTASSAQLPQGRTRVATIHVQISGDEPPEYRIELAVAAGPDGRMTPAQADFSERKP
jgi:hypothetical protein